MSEQVYAIIPSTSAIYWVLVPLVLVLLVAGGVVGYAAWASRHVRFLVSENGIRISGDLYGRSVPAQQLFLDQARAVNLKQEPDLRPGLKTNGAAMPGYRAGWFRLRNGAKALVFLTDDSRVAYLPTTEGYALLLSVADPDSFIRDARARMRR
jgi:hypothetical protein